LLSRPFLNGHARLNRRLGKITPLSPVLKRFYPFFCCDFGDIQRKFQVKKANNMFIVPLQASASNHILSCRSNQSLTFEGSGVGLKALLTLMQKN